MTTDISPEAVERIKAEVMTLDYQGSLWVTAEDYAALSTALTEARADLEAARRFGGGFFAEGVEESTRDVYRVKARAALQEGK